MIITDIGERALLARLRTRMAASSHHPMPDWLLVGIGDDAAVVRPTRGMVDVLTTDAMVEGVHFRRDWSTPADIGHRALTINLSDLAAMGATPKTLLLSLALPASLPLEDFDGVLDGFMALAASSGAHLVGGNLTRSPGPLMIDVTAIGTVRPRRLLRRGGARPGDRVFVTGQLGAAAAGLALRESGAEVSPLDTNRLACIQRYVRPDARLRTGLIVGRNRAASACMDVSDGLADAASALADASGCGIELSEAAIPVHPGARDWAVGAKQSALPLVLSRSDDYELLFAVPRRRTKLFLAAVQQAGETCVTEIGVCLKTPGAWLGEQNGRIPLRKGFEHF